MCLVLGLSVCLFTRVLLFVVCSQFQYDSRFVIAYLVWGDVGYLVLIVVKCLVLIMPNRKRHLVGTTKFVGGIGGPHWSDDTLSYPLQIK